MQLVNVKELFKSMDLTDNGKALVKIAGGHARTLENIRNVISKHGSSESLPRLLQEVNKIQKQSLAPLSVVKPMLSAAVNMVPVQRNKELLPGLTTDDVRSSGYCAYLHVITDPDELIPVLTPFQIIHYFRSLDPRLAGKFRDSFIARKDQYFFGGLNFEWFHSTFECFRRMLWSDKSLGRVEYTTMRQLYQLGGVFADEFEDTRVRLFDAYALEEGHPIKFTPYFVSNGELTSMVLWLI